MSNTITPDWRTKARQAIDNHKQAASTAKDDKDIAEAFAQQAYTIIGNRDRKLMKDPYLLGFEVVEKNEDNNRLVGVFAFRVADEILLAPVFYLNGQIKGQDLLYRKGVNRFVPNTEAWVTYLIAREGDSDGHAVSRNNRSESRLDLGLGRVSRMPYKFAGILDGFKSDDAKEFEAALSKAEAAGEKPSPELFQRIQKEHEERKAKKASEPVDIQQLWKEAMDAWKVTEPEHIFADVLLSANLRKQAADLANRLPEFAELIVKGGLLDHAHEKKASAPDLVFHTEPPAGTDPAKFYARGYTIEDNRPPEKLASAFEPLDEPVKPGSIESAKVESAPMQEAWSSLRDPGINTAVDRAGNKVKVLWAANIEGGNACCAPSYPIPDNHAEYDMVILEGPDKGACIRYDRYTHEGLMPVFANDGEVIPDDDKVTGESPSQGGFYLVWLPAVRQVWGPIYVDSISSTDGVKRINFDKGSHTSHARRLVVHNEIDETLESTLDEMLSQDLTVVGKDAVFVPLKLDKADGSDWTTIRIVPPADFLPLTADALTRAAGTVKKASVKICLDTRSETAQIHFNGVMRAEGLGEERLALKLARDLRLSAEDAMDIAGRVRKGEEVRFNLIRNADLTKVASAFMDRNLDPASGEFDEHDYDADLQIPILRDELNRHYSTGYHDRQVGPTPRWGDARRPGGGNNFDHVPDEVIMRMAHPAMELARLGEAMGSQTLLDHGAVGALTKVFDAAPYITEYVGKLEASLDYLARLLFMLFWKPKDFAKLYGGDDLPQMESKLIGVFTQYGDLVLELLKAVGDGREDG